MTECMYNYLARQAAKLLLRKYKGATRPLLFIYKLNSKFIHKSEAVVRNDTRLPNANLKN